MSDVPAIHINREDITNFAPLTEFVKKSIQHLTNFYKSSILTIYADTTNKITAEVSVVGG